MKIEISTGLILAAIFFSSVCAQAEVISYKKGHNFFRAEKTKTEFIFEDGLGRRALPIEKCNQKMIDKFWKRLEYNSELSERRGPTSVLHSGQGFLSRAADFSHVLFVESRLVCKK